MMHVTMSLKHNYVYLTHRPAQHDIQAFKLLFSAIQPDYYQTCITSVYYVWYLYTALDIV